MTLKVFAEQHLVEHVLSLLADPDSDYVGLLDELCRRRWPADQGGATVGERTMTQAEVDALRPLGYEWFTNGQATNDILVVYRAGVRDGSKQKIVHARRHD